jgi:hypothetical protein
MIENRIPPNEVRGFFHKKDSFLRRLGSALPVVGDVIGMIPDFGGGGSFPARGKACPTGFSGDGRGNCVPNPGATVARVAKVTHPAPRHRVERMPQPVVPVPGFKGAAERFFPGGATGFEVGQAWRGQEIVMGIYGAAEVPGEKIIRRHVCRPGMVLGDDLLCYNRSQIRNSDREWPRGTRPLGTPGEMRALRISARFAGRMDRTNERLQSLGLLKKPTRSRPKKRAKAHGHTVTNT